MVVVFVVIYIIGGGKKKKEEQKEREKRHQAFEREAEIRRQKEKIQMQKYKQELNKAKITYEEALKGKDKRDALNKGRKYYALLRNGVCALSEDYSTELSSRDESRIRTDLQTMNV